jgi:hypothetical protein
LVCSGACLGQKFKDFGESGTAAKLVCPAAMAMEPVWRLGRVGRFKYLPSIEEDVIPEDVFIIPF